MADPPAEQATRRPRRTPHVVALEAELESVRTCLATALADRAAANRTISELYRRAERAERLLALAVDALTRWHLHGDGAGDAALLALVRAAVGLEPDPAGHHAEHPDDDEPPIEP